ARRRHEARPLGAEHAGRELRVAARLAAREVLHRGAPILGAADVVTVDQQRLDVIALHFRPPAPVVIDRGARSSWRKNLPSRARARCRRDFSVPSFKPVISISSASVYTSMSCIAMSYRWFST